MGEVGTSEMTGSEEGCPHSVSSGTADSERGCSEVVGSEEGGSFSNSSGTAESGSVPANSAVGGFEAGLQEFSSGREKCTDLFLDCESSVLDEDRHTEWSSLEASVPSQVMSTSYDASEGSGTAAGIS